MTNTSQGRQRLQIYLEGGEKIEVECEDCEIVRDGFESLRSIRIIGGSPKMVHLDITKVIAIFAELIE